MAKCESGSNREAATKAVAAGAGHTGAVGGGGRRLASADAEEEPSWVQRWRSPPAPAAEWVAAASLLLLALLLLLRYGVLPLTTRGLGFKLPPISSPISSRIFLASLVPSK